MTACDCTGWATDLRVGYPDGHHPQCPQQPHPRATVELAFANELLTQAVLKLPDAVIVGIGRTRDLHTTTFLVNLPDVPDGATQVEPHYTSRRNPDGTQRDYYLSGIAWHRADGTLLEEHALPEPEEPTSA